MINKTLKYILCAFLLLSLSSCKGEVVWNGEVEVMAELYMVLDCSDPYQYIGASDNVFAGTVIEVIDQVVPNKIKDYQDGLSTYKIHVENNLKGELVEEIIVYKHGGLKKDGTMYLVAAETPDGEYIVDSGLPELGKTYIFQAYGQEDGRLILSEIFDNREYDENLLNEYLDYINNEIPFDRERFPSIYDK